MLTPTRAVLAACAASAILVPIVSPPAYADTGAATVPCEGALMTISWAPPAGTSAFTGYLVQDFVQNGFGGEYIAWQDTVGTDQTQASVPVFFPQNDYRVTPVDASGAAVGATIFQPSDYLGGKSPAATSWVQSSNNSVGDRTATVEFGWPMIAGNDWNYTGNEPDTETISGGGQTVVITPSVFGATPVTFTGLTDGRAYTFASDTFDICGDGGTSQSSPVFVPGLEPVWQSATPPLQTHGRHYEYQFEASGKPAPTYQLIGAPSWLQIDKDGLVYGRAPRGMTSFSYSVSAYNGVGIEGLYTSNPYKTVGPFTVTVK
jgi:hypothetical protein